jgi:UDP-N-acetylmuramyl pentapeptide synthase
MPSNKVFLTPTGILQIDVVGDQTAGSVVLMGKDIQALIQQLRHDSRPVLLLDNLKQLGSTDSTARHEVARLARSLEFDRGAMVGSSNAFMRHSTNLMLHAIGRSNLRYFSSFDAAFIWLGVAQTS